MCGQPPLNSFRVLDHATTTGETGRQKRKAKLICHFFENVVSIKCKDALQGCFSWLCHDWIGGGKYQFRGCQFPMNV